MDEFIFLFFSIEEAAYFAIFPSILYYPIFSFLEEPSFFRMPLFAQIFERKGDEVYFVFRFFMSFYVIPLFGSFLPLCAPLWVFPLFEVSLFSSPWPRFRGLR